MVPMMVISTINQNFRHSDSAIGNIGDGKYH